jgi:chemotaxis protein CheX
VKVEYVDPFVRAATEVVERELSWQVERQSLSLLRSAYTTHDVTVLLGIDGKVRGVVLYCLPEATACAMARGMLGHEVTELDPLAQSGLAELGHLISGTAAAYLAEAGYPSTVTAPTVLIGQGTLVSMVDLPRLVIRLSSEGGPFEIHLMVQLSSS